MYLVGTKKSVNETLVVFAIYSTGLDHQIRSRDTDWIMLLASHNWTVNFSDLYNYIAISWSSGSYLAEFEY